MHVSPRFSWILALALPIAACGKNSRASAPPPAAPSTGAPVAFVVDKVTPGKDGKLAVRAYNFSPKVVAGYAVLIRYYDAKGEIVTVQPGTPFEASYDHWSFTGRSYKCAAKSWCSFELEPQEVPATAVKAEVLADSVRALKDDGLNFEDKELFELPGHGWPGADKEPVKWPAAFSAWELAPRQAAWQGAWAGDGAGLGNTAAWLVEGNNITFVDKKGEQKFTLTIDSPCTAGFSGGDGGWQSVYTLKDGQLITGLGDAGARTGNKAIVCGGGSVFVLEGTTCTQWESHFKRWESSPGKCGFKQDNGKEVFTYTLRDYESTLLVEGDVIWSEQLARSHATKYPDLAAAKAAQKL